MKWSIFTGLIFAALVGSAAEPEGKFSQTITPQDFTAAGLDQLTPAQLGHLDGLVKAYMNGDLTAARQSLEVALEAKRVAEAKAVRLEAEAQTTKTEMAKQKKSSEGFFAKAKILLVPGTQIEYAMIESTIPGKFHGWDGRQVFVLANGQSWQISNGGKYFTSAIMDPKVQITPAALTGFYMYFPALDVGVRVNSVDKK